MNEKLGLKCKTTPKTQHEHLLSKCYQQNYNVCFQHNCSKGFTAYYSATKYFKCLLLSGISKAERILTPVLENCMHIFSLLQNQANKVIASTKPSSFLFIQLLFLFNYWNTWIEINFSKHIKFKMNVNTCTKAFSAVHIFSPHKHTDIHRPTEYKNGLN